ncbi:MAG: YoaK family protein [Chloroflexota bacterium]
MASDRPAMPGLRDALLLTLTLACGCMDAISLLALGRVFSSMMTGNMVLLGLALGQSANADLLRIGVALVAFSLGVALGSAIIGRDNAHVVWPRRVTVALGVELALLADFAFVWQIDVARASELGNLSLIAMSAAAMGIQNTAALTLGITSVAKTPVPGTAYLTGTLTSLLFEFVRHAESGSEVGRRLVALGALITGACLTSLALRYLPAAAPLLPLAGLAAVVTCAARAFGAAGAHTDATAPRLAGN